MLVVGVDVGSTSARAGLFRADSGEMLGSASHEFPLHRRGDFAEHSSSQIWAAVCAAVRGAVGSRSGEVRAIGFAATCSLVVHSGSGGEEARDTISWMDHRATREAARLSASGHVALRFVGGAASPEMQLPKLMWLKEHRPAAYEAASAFFGLPDWLTWRASRSDARSLCGVQCKWGALDASLFREAGLEDALPRAGSRVVPPGSSLGRLSKEAALQLRLPENAQVAASLVDAHAGALALLGVSGVELNSRLALVCGTSTCALCVSREPRFIPGVWGPYRDALLPGLWLTEGGQSAAGALLDHVTRGHSYDDLNASPDREGAARLHVLPDYNGNRSPHADPHMRGSIVGLSLHDSPSALYLAHVQALAFGVRHLVETLNDAGYDIQELLVTGGLAKNQVFLQTHADVCQLPVVLPQQPESVLLGAAMLAVKALGESTRDMCHAGRRLEPSCEQKALLDKKYAVFRRLHQHQLEIRALMESE